jgi:hypothetical protein
MVEIPGGSQQELSHPSLERYAGTSTAALVGILSCNQPLRAQGMIYVQPGLILRFRDTDVSESLLLPHSGFKKIEETLHATRRNIP